MSERLFFLNRVRAGISVEEAEQFLRNRDIPMARTVSAITSYSVARVQGWVFDDQGELPYDFIDVIEVSSVTDYRDEIRALENTREWNSFVRDWSQFIGQAVALRGRELH